MRPRGPIKMAVAVAATVLAIVAVVVVAAGIVLATQDFDRYRGDVAAVVRDATGRQLVIAGELDLELSLRPRLIAREVRFANAPWGTRPDMLRFDLLEAEVSALPLLLGEVHVQRIVLSGAKIFLETDRDGHGNWLLDHPPEGADSIADGDAAAAGEGDIPEVHNVVMRDIAITYRDGLSSHQRTLVLDELVANAPDGASRVSLAANGRYEGRAFGISGTVGSIASLVAADAPYPVDLELGIGESALSAALEITLDANPPSITGRLEGPFLRDVDLPFLATPGPGEGDLIDDEPLVLSGLRALDARLELAIDRLESRGFAFEEVAARLVLDGGRLTIAPLNASVAGGAVAVELVLDGGGDLPAVEFGLTGRRVGIDVLLDEITGIHLFEGATDLDFALAGAGRSTRAVAASLQGRMSAVMGEGRVENENLRLLAGDLLTLIDPWAAAIDSDRINCIVLRFDVAKGTARSKTMVLDAESFTIGGGGTLGLGDDRIDLVLDPRPRSEGLLSVAVPINLSGRLSDPTYSTDALDAAGAVLAVLVSLATLPLTALAHAVSDHDGKSNACSVDVETGDVSGVVEKSAIRRVVEGFGHKIKSLFR